MTARPLISHFIAARRPPAPGRILLALIEPLRRRWQSMLDAEHLADQPAYLLADVGLDKDGVARIGRGESPTPRALHRTMPVDRTGRPA